MKSGQKTTVNRGISGGFADPSMETRFQKLVGKIAAPKSFETLVPDEGVIKRMANAARTFLRMWPSSKIGMGVDSLTGIDGWITVEASNLDVRNSYVPAFAEAIESAENLEFYPTTDDTVRMGIMYEDLMIPRVATA